MDLSKISRTLSKDDLIHLIKQLYEKLDNKSKISKITGLTRRILDKYYNEEVKDIKEKTKFRLLGALLKYNREYTLNYLLEHLKNLIASMAYSNLDFFYDKITSTQSYREFRDYYEKFATILYENNYYLIEKYRDEIIGLSSYLEDEHKSLLTNFISPLNIIRNAERENNIFRKKMIQARYFQVIPEIYDTSTEELPTPLLPKKQDSFFSPRAELLIGTTIENLS